MKPLPLALLLALTLASAALRWNVGVHGGDLWLDEAWSVLIARDAAATGRSVFAEPYRVDNNHPLLTWLILVLGPDQPGWVFRAAVFLPTTLLPPLAFLAVRPLGRPAQWVAAVYAATAFPLTVYGTEARGYGLALVAALAALPLTERLRPQPLRVLVYWLVATLGTLAHITFTHALAALIALTALRQWQRVRSVLATLRSLLLWHGPSVLAALLLYLGFLRHIKIAGGPASDLPSALLGAASLSLSLPWQGPWAYGFGAATLLATAAAIVLARREPLALCVPVAYAAAIASVLLKTALHGQPDVLFPRYFLIAVSLGNLVLVALAARAWTAPLPTSAFARRTSLAVLAVLLAAATTLQHALFYARGGRGEYLAPLATVAASPIPTLGSDYPSRTQRLENYYRPRLPARIVYLKPEDSAVPPEWFLLNSATTVRPPPPRSLTHLGHSYHLVSTHPHYGPSGWTWYLYRLSER